KINRGSGKYARPPIPSWQKWLLRFNDPSVAVPRAAVQAVVQTLHPVSEAAESIHRGSVCHRHFCLAPSAQRSHWRFPPHRLRRHGSYPMRQKAVPAVADGAADLPVQRVLHSEAALVRWVLSCRNPARSGSNPTRRAPPVLIKVSSPSSFAAFGPLLVFLAAFF